MTNKDRILSIHVTDLCNSRCTFCVVGIPERKGESVFPGEIRRALEDNADKGYEAVNLHGGEPTIHPRLIEILELAKSLGYPEIQIQTNGRTMKNRAFVQQLVELNVKLFIVSMHGLTGETHDAITRSKGGFDETIQGIRNAKKLGARIRTNTVICKQNIHELPAIVDMVLDEGATHINISNLHPVETAYLHFEQVTPTVAEVLEWVPKAADRALSRGVPLTLEGFPYCITPGLELYHLEYREIGMQIRGLWIVDYDRFMGDVCRVKGKICQECSYNEVCTGVYREYIEKRGWGEFEPVTLSAAEG
jgi:MoaA/NifB/PqqE/SkfB family radical SAM enzyme